MKRLRYEGEGRIALEDVAEPQRNPGEVLIAVEASALCGSERAAILGGHASNAGHEAAGIVLEADASSSLVVGQRVGATAVTGCGRCAQCQAGRETQCRQHLEVASGWHAERIVVAERAVRRVDPTWNATMAALATGDALGVPARALRKRPAVPGERVIVVGLGPVGLGHVLLRSWSGAEVIGVEPSAFRRDQALTLGATATYEPGADIEQAPLVIECTGVPGVIEGAFDLVSDRGTLFQSGECHHAIALTPSVHMVHRELTYTGSWYYATEDFADMTRMVTDGLPLEALCTEEVPYEQAPQAIDRFMGGTTGKVIFRWLR